MANYIRFDWAMKRLLRDKANYGVLEGLITTLLGRTMKIRKLIQPSQLDEESRYRADFIVETPNI